MNITTTTSPTPRSPGRPKIPNARRCNLPWRVPFVAKTRLEFYSFALGISAGDLLNELLDESIVAEYSRRRGKKDTK